jgi:chromatin assembly factor 1 subunit B
MDLRSPDGQCLMLSSRDGYCTIVVFDDILPAHHTQQQTLQFQSIAHHHSLPVTSSIATPLSTPSVQAAPLPSISPALTPVVPMKRMAEPPLTPAASVDESVNMKASTSSDVPAAVTPSSPSQEPPKKKRRAVLTRVSDTS